MINFVQKLGLVNKFLLLFQINLLRMFKLKPKLQLIATIDPITIRIIQQCFYILVDCNVVGSLKIQSVLGLIVFYKIWFFFVYYLILESEAVFFVSKDFVFYTGFKIGLFENFIILHGFWVKVLSSILIDHLLNDTDNGVIKPEGHW